MKAMIFAAGLGTRLKPLTNHTPKALVPVNGKPMLQRTIEHLSTYGFNDIIINVHHHAEQIIHFLQNINIESTTLSISDESDKLLDTGGGLKKASWFFDDPNPFLVINADVISDLNLTTLFSFHQDHNALATLVVRNRSSSRSFLFDSEFRLSGWKNFKTGERIMFENEASLHAFPFSGIHVLNPEIFSHMKEQGKFSIVDTYLRLANKYKIVGYLDQSSNWFDIGNPEKLQQAEEWLQNH